MFKWLYLKFIFINIELLEIKICDLEIKIGEMKVEKIIHQTELTIVFTREGKIVIPINENGKYSIFPKYDVGSRNLYQKVLDRDVDSFLIKKHCKDENEYKRQISEEIGSRDKRYSESAVKEGWFIGNEKALIDMGELSNSIYSHQVLEMKKCENSGYIRAGRNTFYLKSVDNIELYENVGYRFLLLPQGFSEQNFRGLISYSIEELEDIIRKSSDTCTLDLHIAIRQLDKAKLMRFVNEVIKEQEVKNEEPER